MDRIFGEVGERIKRAREERGWTQAQLATAVGYSDATIGNYESGRRGVGLDDLYKIAAALNKPFGYFVGVEAAATESIRSQIEQEIRRDMAGFVGVRLLPLVADPSVRPLLQESNIVSTIPVAREFAGEAQFLIQVRTERQPVEYWFCKEVAAASDRMLVVGWVPEDRGERVRLLRLHEGGYWPIDATDGLQAWLPNEVTVHASLVARYVSGVGLARRHTSKAGYPALEDASRGLSDAEISEVLRYVEFLKSRR